MKKTIIAFTLMAASSTAFADSWIYGGAAVGQSSINSDTGTSYTVHAGTGILPLIGVEAGFTSSGDIDTGSHETTDVSTIYVAIKPSIDLGPLHLYAKGGLHSWKETVSLPSGDTDDDGIDITYGVGAEWFISGPISVGASYQNYKLDGDDMSTISLNATIHFL
jgi:hypothetical protein